MDSVSHQLTIKQRSGNHHRVGVALWGAHQFCVWVALSVKPLIQLRLNGVEHESSKEYHRAWNQAG